MSDTVTDDEARGCLFFVAMFSVIIGVGILVGWGWSFLLLAACSMYGIYRSKHLPKKDTGTEP